MNTYKITVKGKGQKEAQGENPQEAFASLFPNIELQEIKDKVQAQVCIELLNGKRKSRTFYYIKKVNQVQNKAKVSTDDKYSDLAKAFVCASKALLYVGDSYNEVVSIICFNAKLKFDAYDTEQYYGKKEFKDCSDEDDVLDRALYLAYKKMLDENNTRFVELDLQSWKEYDYYEKFEEEIQDENVKNIKQSTIYNSLSLICKYAVSRRLNRENVEVLKTFLERLRGVDVDAINIGYAVGHSYFREISKNFGTVTNDFFTVGHQITKSEEKEHKEYKGYGYVLHKDINEIGSPDTPLCALFKTDKENVYIEILLGRQSYLSETARIGGIVGYIYNFGTMTFKKKERIETIASQLAQRFNKLLPVIYDIADNNQSLYRMKDFNAPLETITNVNHITDDRLLLDAAISRWTTIRGEKSPARIEKIQMKDAENIKALYANNISEVGLDSRLYVEYTNGNFTICVIRGIDLSNVICKETIKMSGPINKNSHLIAKAMGSCLIAANFEKV